MRPLVLAVLAVAAVAARGQGAKKGDASAELARLEQEVALQRQILTNLLQDQVQRDSLLLQLLNARGGPAASAALPQAREPGSALQESSGPALAAGAMGPGPAQRAPPGRAVSGRVLGADGAPLPAGSWAFLQDISAPAKGATLEIAQRNKAFIPAAAVIQRGTRVVFSNADAVFHDVFSHSPTNSFELGSMRTGTKGAPVAMTRPGLVDVFCNFHSKMNAQLLVVPGPHIAKADEKGEFKLENVPPGRHTLGAWTPNAKLVTVAIDVAGDVSGVDLKLAPSKEVKTHLNKEDRAYGSYEP
jgi:plastocyanin